jgi:hypothetical protein
MYALHEGFQARAMLIADRPAAPTRAPIMGEAAAPDVPREIGYMILAAYVAIMSAFLVLFTGSAEATMMVVISTLYATIFFAVPIIFLKTENRPSRLRLSTFMKDGLDTWTGHVDGRAAIIQMLSIPITIAVAVTTIGLMFRIAI